MPQYDIYHETVKRALAKDNWLITDDPFIIEYKGLRLYADLGAEKFLAAQKQERKIVVEVRSFNSPSLITELEKAIDQYSIYRTFLKRLNLDRELYMAIERDVYDVFFQKPAIQEIIFEEKILWLVFDSGKEELLLWTS